MSSTPASVVETFLIAVVGCGASRTFLRGEFRTMPTVVSRQPCAVPNSTDGGMLPKRPPIPQPWISRG